MTGPSGPNIVGYWQSVGKSWGLLPAVAALVGGQAKFMLLVAVPTQAVTLAPTRAAT